MIESQYTLVHAEDYDPAERRQRYLRERELKGRAPAKLVMQSGDSSKKKTLSTKAKPTARLVSLSTRQREAKEKAKAVKVAKEKIAVIREKIKELEKALKKLLARQKESEAKAKQGPTQSEKRKAREASKKSYEKNKTKINAEKRKATKSLPTQIAETREKITQVKQQLATALANFKKLG